MAVGRIYGVVALTVFFTRKSRDISPGLKRPAAITTVLGGFHCSKEGV